MTHNHAHYAVYQSGHVILGVGDTQEAAIADANRYLRACHEPLLNELPLGGGGETIGETYLAPCTSALAQKVARKGGDISWRAANGVLDVDDED